MNTAVADNRIRILSVDDHLLLREGIAAVIGGEPDMTVVGEATNGLEAIQSYKALRPHVVLMDLRMPSMGGFDAITAIRNGWPSARIIVLTTYGGDAQALAALRAGAAGYLLKSMLRKELLDAIRTVHAGKRYIPAKVAADIAEYAIADVLTTREVHVLKLVAAGNSNKLIAAELEISESTVKAHMKSILPKLEANDRTHAVMIALKRGILDV